MDKLLRPIYRIIDTLNNVALWASTFMLMGMLAIVTLNVILRYIFSYSIIWTEEGSRYLMVWVTFLLLPYAQQKGSLVAVDFLVARFRYTRAGVILAIFIELLILLVLSVCLYQAYFFVERSAATLTMALRLPMWMVTVIMPYSFGLTALISLLWLIKLIPCLFNPEKLRIEDARRAGNPEPEYHAIPKISGKPQLQNEEIL